MIFSSTLKGSNFFLGHAAENEQKEFEMIFYFSARMRKIGCSIAVYFFVQPFLISVFARNFKDSIQNKEVSAILELGIYLSDLIIFHLH